MNRIFFLGEDARCQQHMDGDIPRGEFRERHQHAQRESTKSVPPSEVLRPMYPSLI